MKIRFSPRASISIALVEVGNFARKKDERKKKERGREKEWRRKGGWWEKETGRRGERGCRTASLPQLDKYFQFFGRTSLYRRSNATLPPTFWLNSFSKCEKREGEGSISSSFELSRAAFRHYRSIEFLKMKACFVSWLIGKGGGGLFIRLGLCIRFRVRF